MKLDDIKEQKMMSAELKKMNLTVKLLYVVVLFLCITVTLQAYSMFSINKKFSNVVTQSDIVELKNEISEVKKKVHFRYFNLTNSLEDIHKVKINTQNGHLKK